MFPIPWNFPFRKKDGSVTNISDAMSGGGGQSLPIASESTLGGIKVGSGLTINSSGVLSASGGGGGGGNSGVVYVEFTRGIGTGQNAIDVSSYKPTENSILIGYITNFPYNNIAGQISFQGLTYSPSNGQLTNGVPTIFIQSSVARSDLKFSSIWFVPDMDNYNPS